MPHDHNCQCDYCRRPIWLPHYIPNSIKLPLLFLPFLLACSSPPFTTADSVYPDGGAIEDSGCPDPPGVATDAMYEGKPVRCTDGGGYLNTCAKVYSLLVCPEGVW
jgi:hypothetical protein